MLLELEGCVSFLLYLFGNPVLLVNAIYAVYICYVCMLSLEAVGLCVGTVIIQHILTLCQP